MPASSPAAISLVANDLLNIIDRSRKLERQHWLA
jgi:hypothetical protein